MVLFFKILKPNQGGKNEIKIRLFFSVYASLVLIYLMDIYHMDILKSI